MTSRAYEEQQRAMTLIMVADSGEKEKGGKKKSLFCTWCVSSVKTK